MQKIQLASRLIDICYFENKWGGRLKIEPVKDK